MALTNMYTQVYGQIGDFFKTIQEGQAPEKFTQQYLKDIGFSSTNHRAFIPMLKALGFLTDDGVPTSRYHNYRDTSQSKKVIGKALKEAYSDLFTIKAHPKPTDKDKIIGKFKSTYNTSDRIAELMAKTFLSLLELADIDQEKNKEHDNSTTHVSPKDTFKDEPQQNKTKPLPALHYNIQIHLPATKDVEVYNAIFKSIKEHLID